MNTPDNSDLIRTNTGHLLLPQSPEGFTHDADGNLTADGRWTYTWNGSPREMTRSPGAVPRPSVQIGLAGRKRLLPSISRGRNRLIALETASGAVTAGKPAQRLEFAYDHQGRRIRKRMYAWDSGSGVWVLGQDSRFLYDGWNLIGIFDALNSQPPTLNRSFTWGLDLSGSEQGAGGVGGLLLTTDHGLRTTGFACFDGNGNVMALVDAGTGLVTAQYEYGPFSELLRATGPMAKANPFRFSTKYQDDETDLLYYGYRFLDVALGRWVNRDPIEETGGQNVYGLAGNDSVDGCDPFGFKGYSSDWYSIRRHPWFPNTSPELLRGQVIVSVDGTPPNQSIRISFKANRPDTPENKRHWAAMENWYNSPVTDGWNFPNLAGALNARGPLRYGGDKDPGELGVDNDFAAIVVQRQNSSNLSGQLVSGDWDSGSLDKAAVSHNVAIAREFHIPMAGPFCPEPPPVELWFVACDLG